MNRILIVLSALLLATAAALYLLLENPNQFKPQIEEIVKANTGYPVNIDGDLSWRYWPPVAIRVEQLSLGQQNEQPLASFEHIEVDVDLMPILQRQKLLNVGLISVGGGTIHVTILDSGASNWDALAAQPSADADTSQDSPATPLESSIEELRIENLIVHYHDQLMEERYQVKIDSLATSAISAERPFSIDLSASVQDQINSISADADVDGEITLHAVNRRIAFNNLKTRIDYQSAELSLTNIRLTTSGELRTREQVISLSDSIIQVAGIETLASGLINLAGDEPRFDGQIKMAGNDLNEISELLETELPFKSVAFQSRITASPSAVRFSNLSGQFDDHTFSGQSNWNLGTPIKGNVDLRMPKLDLDRYAATSESRGVDRPQNTSDVDNTELIPVELFSELHLDAIIRVEDLIAGGYKLNNTKIESHNTQEALDVAINGEGLGGKLLMTVDTDLSKSPIESYVSMSLDKMDIQQITEMQGLTGTITGNTTASFLGSTMNDLSQTISGRSLYTVQDGSLDVRPLKNMAAIIDQLRGKQSSISEWPDIMSFEQMSAEHVLSDGFETGQILRASVENLDLMATGGFDLNNETMNYELTAMFRSSDQGQFKVSRQLANIRWPLTCQGPFSATPAELCLSREGAINSLVASIVKQDLERRGKDKLNELIEENAPEELQDLLKGLFK